jgi:DNA invertase Pin-like site-specific DNA recombinase
VIVIYARGLDSNRLRDYATLRWNDGEILATSDGDQLLRMVRAGHVEIVLASGLQGLARSSSELVQVLRDFVAHKGILIIPGAIDTSRVPRKVVLDVLTALDEFKQASVESIREGLAAAKSRGVKLGRPRTVDPARRAEIAAMRANGLSGRAIARRLALSPSTVFKAFRSPAS